MQYRRLGRTGLKISEIGFGAWGIGGLQWIGAEDSVSLRALHRAADLGLNFIDTALAYGEGHSERVIRRFLEERGAGMIVATKIPPKDLEWPALHDSLLEDVFPAEHIVSSTELSLRNLGLDCLDLQQFHVWNDRWASRDEWKEAVEKLKREGKVRHFGISINDYQPENGIQAAESGLIDFFQVIYNIFEQEPERTLFPYCRRRDLGVIARVPLDEGALTGNITADSVFPPDDWRNGYFRGDRRREVQQHVEPLRFLLRGGIRSLAEAALRFCLSHPDVSTVIAGMRKVDHAEENCAVSDGRGLPREDIEHLKSHVWAHDYYR